MINNKVDYKVLKDLIRRACRQKHKNSKSMEFFVDLDRLADLVIDLQLIPVAVGLHSKKVDPNVIPFVSEYHEKTDLSWYSEGKFYTVLTFMDNTGLDDKARKIMERIATPQIDDPLDDKVHDIAYLIANYRCYFALVTSYQNNDPRFIDRPSYTVACRANKVVIKDPDYQYNPKDFS